MMDELTKDMLELTKQNVIPDMQDYAQKWYDLSMRAEKEDRPASASSWRQRAKYYADLCGCGYIRLVEGSFSELVRTDEEPGAYDWQQRKDLE